MKVNVYPNLLQSTIKETNMTSIDSIMFVIETYLLYKYIYIYEYLYYWFFSRVLLFWNKNENIRDKKWQNDYELLNFQNLKEYIIQKWLYFSTGFRSNFRPFHASNAALTFSNSPWLYYKNVMNIESNTTRTLQ